eukprot:6201817-Pleurochrysis_carterae.AAC.5
MRAHARSRAARTRSAHAQRARAHARTRTQAHAHAHAHTCSSAGSSSISSNLSCTGAAWPAARIVREKGGRRTRGGGGTGSVSGLDGMRAKVDAKAVKGVGTSLRRAWRRAREVDEANEGVQCPYGCGSSC